MKNLLKFAFPIMVGNLLQQLYNIADTLIVGRILGGARIGSSGFFVYINGVCYFNIIGALYGQ